MTKGWGKRQVRLLERERARERGIDEVMNERISLAENKRS